MWRQPDQGCKQDLHMLLEPLDAPEGIFLFSDLSKVNQNVYGHYSRVVILLYLMVHGNLLPFFALKNNQCQV